MMSVMVPFSSDSISSTGPGIGSCWHRCSARRICCRFCQMISASFSHLGGAGLSTHWAQHPIPPHPTRHSPGLQHIQGAFGWAPIPCQLLPTLPLDQLIIQDGCLLLAQQLQRLLVLLSQVLQGGTTSGVQGQCHRASWGTRWHHSPHGTAVVSGPHGAARPPTMPSSAAASSPVTCAPGGPAGRAGRTGLGDRAWC